MATNGFDREELQAPLAEINTTPLVDVMLVLLVIFLVTAPVLNNAIHLELPQETAQQISNQKAIIVSLDSKGQYYWNDQPVNEALLDQKLKSTALNNPKESIHIRADTNVNYGKVSHILAIAQANGLTNVGFITEPSK